MHYIRFLKPPVLTRLPDASAGWKATAKITVTSDLGESFLIADLPLSVNILEADGKISKRFTKTVEWKAWSRHLEITSMLTHSSRSSVAPSVNWPCRMMIHALDQEHHHSRLHDLIQSPDGNDQVGKVKMRGGVIPLLSEPFDPSAPKGELKIVERSLTIGEQDRISIWEETGESIARHVWDAGLLLSSYIHGLKYGFASYAPKALSKLPELLSNPNIRVLELGAGCGIVGITLCRCYPQSSVILSDLPEAEEIATYNIARNERQAGSLQKQMNVKYQNINWEDPLPENLRTGDLDLVVVADCTYNPDVVPDLVKILADITTHNPGVLILLAMKVRHDSEIIFFDLMKEKKLEIVDKVLLPLPVLEEENQEIEIYLFEQQ